MKIFLVGFMGSGKTHWGKLLGEKLNLPFFDLDEQIIANEGKSVEDIFLEYGEEYFRLLEKDVLHILTESHESFIMATGGGTPCFFNNIDYLKKNGLSIWINTSVDVLYNRLLVDSDKRPLIKNLTDIELRDFISKKFSDRKIFYQQAELIIDDELIKLNEFVEKIFHA